MFSCSHTGARDQYTHYRTDDEEVTEGLDATVARKLAAKYDLALQDEVCAWAAGLGVVLASGSMDGFMDALKDGQKLCQLVNKIKPGSVRKVNKMKMPFMQMENISSFLTAAVAIGVDSSETFQVRAVHSLLPYSRAVYTKPDFVLTSDAIAGADC
jgi:hypothetical protein